MNGDLTRVECDGCGADLFIVRVSETEIVIECGPCGDVIERLPRHG